MSQAQPPLPSMLPPPAPLDMPVQRLDGPPPGSIEVLTQPHGLLVKRLLLIATTAVLALAASTQVRMAMARAGLDPLDLILLVLFVPLFSWISFGPAPPKTVTTNGTRRCIKPRKGISGISA